MDIQPLQQLHQQQLHQQQLHQHISLQKQPIQNYSPAPVSSDQAQASEEGGGVVDPPTTHTHTAGHCYNY